jgi:hypothetical protein
MLLVDQVQAPHFRRNLATQIVSEFALLLLPLIYLVRNQRPPRISHATVWKPSSVMCDCLGVALIDRLSLARACVCVSLEMVSDDHLCTGADLGCVAI